MNLQRGWDCLTVMVEKTVLIEPWGSTLLTDLREVSTVYHPSWPKCMPSCTTELERSYWLPMEAYICSNPLCGPDGMGQLWSLVSEKNSQNDLQQLQTLGGWERMRISLSQTHAQKQQRQKMIYIPFRSRVELGTHAWGAKKKNTPRFENLYIIDLPYKIYYLCGICGYDLGKLLGTHWVNKIFLSHFFLFFFFFHFSDKLK